MRMEFLISLKIIWVILRWKRESAETLQRCSPLLLSELSQDSTSLYLLALSPAYVIPLA